MVGNHCSHHRGKDGDIPPPFTDVWGGGFQFVRQRSSEGSNCPPGHRQQEYWVDTTPCTTSVSKCFSQKLDLNVCKALWRWRLPRITLLILWMLHWDALMYTLQLILMSRCWSIFKTEANFHPEFAQAKGKHSHPDRSLCQWSPLVPLQNDKSQDQSSVFAAPDFQPSIPGGRATAFQSSKAQDKWVSQRGYTKHCAVEGYDYLINREMPLKKKG